MLLSFVASAMTFIQAAQVGQTLSKDVIELPPIPALESGETLAQIEKNAKEAFEGMKKSLQQSGITTAEAAAYADAFKKVAENFKTYIEKKDPKALQAYYDAYAKMQSESDKIAQQMALKQPAVVKSLKIKPQARKGSQA